MLYAVFRLFVSIGGEESGDPDNTRTTKQQAVWLSAIRISTCCGRLRPTSTLLALAFLYIVFRISLELLFTFLTFCFSSEVFFSWVSALATPL